MKVTEALKNHLIGIANRHDAAKNTEINAVIGGALSALGLPEGTMLNVKTWEWVIPQAEPNNRATRRREAKKQTKQKEVKQDAITEGQKSEDGEREHTQAQGRGKKPRAERSNRASAGRKVAA